MSEAVDMDEALELTDPVEHGRVVLMHNAQVSIAGEVRAELARQQITDEQMARHFGQHQTWFNRRKNGHVPFSGAELAAVAAYLSVDVAVFFNRVPTLPSDPGAWVGPVGLEPTTHGLKVHCSAN